MNESTTLLKYLQIILKFKFKKLAKNPKMDRTIPPFDPNQSPPTAWQIFKDIHISEYFQIFKIPCAQRSFLQGIALGSVIGGSRYIMCRKRQSAINWGFFSFLTCCIISWEYCRYQRRLIQVQLEAMNSISNSSDS